MRATKVAKPMLMSPPPPPGSTLTSPDPLPTLAKNCRVAAGDGPSMTMAQSNPGMFAPEKSNVTMSMSPWVVLELNLSSWLASVAGLMARLLPFEK